MLCACTQKPWNYKDSTWYSEEPNISIYWHETKWCGKLKSSDDTIEIVLVWGGAMGFNIFEKKFDIFNTVANEILISFPNNS